MTGDRPAYLSFPDQLDHADVIEYLFYCAGCGAGFDVITDSLEGSIEGCKRIAEQYGDVLWHKK